MSDYSFDQFVAEWERAALKESASAQSHFNALCRALGHPQPHEQDPEGRAFTYEYGVEKTGGGRGFADVFYDGHFAIEYKTKGKYATLDEAYQQLLRYREKLNNPPLLVVCDIARWEIHTNFPNTEKKVYRFANHEILQPTVQGYLHALFHNPAALHPARNTEQVTQEAADAFKDVADQMRAWKADPERIAHFLTKLVFCLFAEDVHLLPPFRDQPHGLFTEILSQHRSRPDQFKRYTELLFRAMAHGGDFLMQDVPYFNGQLFEDVQVEDVEADALSPLYEAAKLNWASVEPAIFGTLFERSLDKSKRAQLGAHYTSRADIEAIVEPVLMQPLREEWVRIQEQAVKVRAGYDAAHNGRERHEHLQALDKLRDYMLARLRSIRVLDPACGSGNFLYMALHQLLDMEKAVLSEPSFSVLAHQMPGVHPRQLHGIEIDPIAHALASIVVWIGYIQWRASNGYRQFTEPILEPLGQKIRHMDAILGPDDRIPEWPEVDVIVGNPPFLGGKRMRAELGDAYVDRLFARWGDRVPREADLVTYWFEHARAQLEAGKAKRVGLLATNSIRGGKNRVVLQRIKETGDIFMAWADRAWTLEGAAVRVSMVGFDDGSQTARTLDGQAVPQIFSDLTAAVDITRAARLPENANLAFMGMTPAGPFDIDGALARKMRAATNPSGADNRDVVKPYLNAMDIVQRSRDRWTIDFGTDTPEDQAARHELPYQHLLIHVKPVRTKNKRQTYNTEWWMYERRRPALRQALAPLKRYIVTPLVSKHRVYAWVEAHMVASNLLNAIARDDDYFFGVLHSRVHELWSLRMGTSLEDRPRYTPTTTFETFPFPWVPGQEDSTSPAYAAVAQAANALHTERQTWLETPGDVSKQHTLTNLYNALQAHRGQALDPKDKLKAAAKAFAPRLAELHDALDRAVCDAYGWPHGLLNDEEALLGRLLALNQARLDNGTGDSQSAGAG